MKFAKKMRFLPKSNFCSDLSVADMDLVYFVVKITGVKNGSISNRRLSLVRITLFRHLRTSAIKVIQI